jgi:hypothetical protein
LYLFKVVKRLDPAQQIPTPPALLRYYRSSHTAYLEDLEAEKEKATPTDQEMKNQKEFDNKEKEAVDKMKLAIIKKRKDAETLIAEATARLNAAAVTSNMTEVMAAQALLVSGNAKLHEASKEQEELDKMPPAKKPRTA